MNTTLLIQFFFFGATGLVSSTGAPIAADNQGPNAGGEIAADDQGPNTGAPIQV